MGLLDWFKRKPIQAAAPRVIARVINAKYDSAQTDDDNKRHWSQSDSLSARQANSPSVRESLRNRSRYEVANNCYARGIINMLADVVIGYGPTLSLQGKPDATEEERKALRETKQLFCDWAEEVGLWQKLWTMRVAKAQDGEAFAVLRNNEALQFVQLDLQLVEAEQVADGYQNYNSILDPTKVDGIDTDSMGNPIRYRVLPHHPSDAPFGQQPIEVPAWQVLHWFKQERPGQLRGIPEITPALPLFAQLRRFTLATLTAAETAADFAAVLQGVPADEGEMGLPWDNVEIQRGTMLTTPEGTTLGQLKAEHPTTTYEMFKREILCEVGRCLQLPRMMALLDASNYNYSSGRLDKQCTDRAIEIDQFTCEQHVLRKLWMAWFDEASKIAGYLPEAVADGLYFKVKWLWPQLGHVDRQKEESGVELAIANGTTTLALECAKAGLDVDEVLEQLAAERRRKVEFGLMNEGVQNANQSQQGSGNVPGSSSRQPVSDGEG